MKVPLIIIGGGLSGLAAGIRCSRYCEEVLILEKHSRLGGLNSYYYRNKQLFETGLHAITNFAEKKDKKAPLNRLLRQLRIKRDQLNICPQISSEVKFPDVSIRFSNDFELLQNQIQEKFPAASQKFENLLNQIDRIDPFATTPFTSARKFLDDTLQDPLLTDMLLCPLMYYGSSVENDMDLGQFVIMFTAIFKEGMFRPAGSIKDFIQILTDLYIEQGGKIRKSCGVKQIIIKDNDVTGVELDNGEFIECNHLLSTIGHQETLSLISRTNNKVPESTNRLGFIETIYQLPNKTADLLPKDTTIVFYNNASKFQYQQTQEFADYASGVICFPQNFSGLTDDKYIEVRSTHLASYNKWKSTSANREEYLHQKSEVALNSAHTLEKLIGKFHHNTVYSDTFTPLTIERYTSKIEGAIYGSPSKVKDGNLGYNNLFLAGTDQGFLGIIGSMLSGVSIVNQHILPKL